MQHTARIHGHIVLTAIVLFTGAAAAARAQTPLTPFQVVQRAAARAQQDQAALENYAYHQRDIVSTVNKDKPPSVRQDETEAVSEVDGVEYDRVIERNGKPLSAKDAEKEEHKAADFIRKHSGAQARAKALAQQVKAEKEQEQLIAAIPQAFTVAFAPPGTPNPCDCYVVTLTPRADFHVNDDNLKKLQHVGATAWVDRSDFGLQRVEIRILKTLSAGWFLMRMEPGSTITMDDENIDGHWFEKSVEGTLTARLLLIKTYHVLFNEACTDYRKFGVTTKVITAGAEVKH